MIEVEGLTKYYGEHAAIRDLAFTINKGEVIGFLGLNGAGKSTTLRVLACVLLPTSGRLRIDGHDVVREPHEVRKRIGFLPDRPPLYEEMTVGDYLAFVARLRGVEHGVVDGKVRAAEEKTGLRDAHEALVGTLSHGYRQRVGVAQALVHEPQLLILDEPTSGLDPVQIVEMRQLIRNLRGAHTILLSSHILSEISQTCDRLLVIQAGEIVAQGSEEELARGLGGGTGEGAIEIEVGGTNEAAVKSALSVIEGVGKIDFNPQGDVLGVRLYADAKLLPALVRALVKADIDVLRVDRRAPQLERIFLQLTQAPAQTGPYRSAS